eukprot:CAMPEP_0181479390 /NCGR_PEP_ID=MMETSP1110-20121109/43259_1 /TAXON_ID=174948 /ORGANISM="Symbiodinium sp., Strain CCMP421" /LENGTH=280 /DNA_ID=CAMNT_0023604825 /DNA_START=585 /DNA_END=1427 /DNA_ORIENTATION=-
MRPIFRKALLSILAFFFHQDLNPDLVVGLGSPATSASAARRPRRVRGAEAHAPASARAAEEAGAAGAAAGGGTGVWCGLDLAGRLELSGAMATSMVVRVSLQRLQGTLGVATGCVASNLDAKWGWRPELAGSGSNTGGPYDVYGEGLTLVGVETPSGSWQFMLRKPSASQGGASHVAVTVHSYHRGDATPQQETDLIHFADSCFSKEDVDTSNLGSLQFSLLKNVDCVLQKCLEAWGFKPEFADSGSDNGGPYDAYGLGATVIGVESPSGKWEFVLRLKN